MTRQKRKNPGAGGRRGSVTAAFGQSHSTSKPTAARRGWQGHRMPSNWRERMPEPETYYRARVEKLGPRHGNGWAQGRCPFHEDKTASLSVRLDGERGHWRCFAGCGHGDLVAFHMRLSGMGFVEAVRDLVGGAR
ncbi:MAG: hypothetical protein KF800_06640 [Lysobacter sp.]|nr:hypothetical protein [Lysobacter sp.]